MAESTCIVNGCDRPLRTRTAKWCAGHYLRWYKTGDVGPAVFVDQKRKPCSLNGCDELACGLGFCSKHYQRFKTHGDPTVVLSHLKYREDHWAWGGDNIKYGPAHERVRASRGSASEHACVSCGHTAQQWAYDHGDSAEKVSEYGPYSTDVSHYRAMCVPCHKTFDLNFLATCRAPKPVEQDA